MSQLDESDIDAEIKALLAQQAAQSWGDEELPGEVKKEESIIRRGVSKISSRPSKLVSSSRSTVNVENEEEPVGWSRLPSEIPFAERIELIGAAQVSSDGRSSWLELLTTDHVRELASAMGFCSFSVGEHLFTAQEPAMCAAIILRGSIGEMRGGRLVVRHSGV